MMAVVNENPLDDLALAFLDDLQEGTLLSLLEDNDLFNHLQDYTLSPVPSYESDVWKGSDNLDSGSFDTSTECMTPTTSKDEQCGAVEDRSVATTPNQTHLVYQNVGINQGGLERYLPSSTYSGSETDISSMDSNDSDSADGTSLFISSKLFKKCELESDAAQEHSFLTSCVHHDHCYTHASLQQSECSSSSAGCSAVAVAEEGNCSDTGTCTCMQCTCT